MSPFLEGPAVLRASAVTFKILNKQGKLEIRGGEVENSSDGALVVSEQCAVGDGAGSSWPQRAEVRSRSSLTQLPLVLAHWWPAGSSDGRAYTQESQSTI